jgi:energy-coupling factor transporter ATP-binding protein EcfA2
MSMNTLPIEAHPPKTLLEVLQKIELEKALELNDPRFVDTRAARGSEKTLSRLARKFGLDLATGAFAPTTSRHVLFFGHTGSGKSTELRHYAKHLSGPEKFLVVEVDISLSLDLHNVQYADVLMAMAKALLEALKLKQVAIAPEILRPLEDWFQERVVTSAKTREFSNELKAGVEGKSGLLFLGSIFAKLTSSFKNNATYKDTLREVIRNNFAEFAIAFNGLLRKAEDALTLERKARRVIFVVDGTDKLRSEDRSAFFVQDAEQLLAIETLVIYSAPLSLKYEGNLVSKLDADLVLPMIKLYERDGARCEAGWAAMRTMLLLRADKSLFSGQPEIDRIIDASGGHPREMLRILKSCCEYAEENVITNDLVGAAVKLLASDFRRFLDKEDYLHLANVDQNLIHGGNDERTRKLLYNLALLEYNDGGWQRSHPAVRTLEGYQAAASVLLATKA